MGFPMGVRTFVAFRTKRSRQKVCSRARRGRHQVVGGLLESLPRSQSHQKNFQPFLPQFLWFCLCSKQVGQKPRLLLG